VKILHTLIVLLLQRVYCPPFGILERMPRTSHFIPKAHHPERSHARLLAVQALYQQALAPKPSADLVREFIHFRVIPYEEAGKIHLPALDKQLFGALVTGIIATQSDLDGIIVGHLDQDWRLERLDRVVVAILQAGLWEIINAPETPVRVIINEYLDVARSFFDGKEPAFINRVLDSAARKLRQCELNDTPPL
jgi:transcription antitermination protein NusB